jgi:pimeloyl-ACP methyl ester carboxylesterase
MVAGPALTLRGIRRQPPPPSPDKSLADPEVMFFDQVLDHFTATDGRTWQQRYSENLEFYVEGGPVFIMIGGEAEASWGWLKYGQWFKWAQQHGAAMFLLEHRFYGASAPTEDMSTENMVYLSSRQGLQDLAHFITAMNTKYSFTSKAITFGGSYPGSLSGWMRLKFPNLIQGSVASSGPVLAQLDFQEYLQVVMDALDTTGPGCNVALEEAIVTIQAMLESEDSWGELASLFTTCTPLDGTNDMDVKSFMELVIDNLAGIVQYNGLQNQDIFSVCAILTDETVGSPLERLAAVNTLMLSEAGAECLDHTYEAFLNQITDVHWSGTGFDWRPWLYQTCTEFGWYQTTNQESGIYGSLLDLGFFEKWCQDAFGPSFTHEAMEKHMLATNIEYGGINPDESNVVFVHGTIDPWHAMGILDDISSSATSIFIEGTSHCNDMYGDRGDDSEDLTSARLKIGELVAQWVGQAKLCDD